MFQQIARFFLYTVPLALMLVLPSTFFPFIGSKYYAFRILVTLAAVCAFLGWAFEGEPLSLKERFGRVLRSPAGIGFVLLTAAILLATAFAYDPSAAFWSNFERGEGAFQFLHYLVFFVLIAGLFTERGHWKTIMWTSVVAAGGVILYGVFSAVSPDAFLGPYRGADGGILERLFLSGARFQGALGNAAYVTPYLIFIGAYIAWLWHGAQTRLKSSILAALGILVALTFFVLSGTRGAFLGLVAGLLAGALYYAWKKPKHRRWIAGVIALGIVSFGSLFLFRDNPRVAALPGARFLQIDVTQVTAQTRFWTWNAAFEGFKDRPILGYGPENFPVVFDKHFDPRHFEPGKDSETWFDRAHNIVLDYLATTGVVGLAAWLAFITLVFVQVRRAMRSRALSTFEEALLLGLPVAYVVQSLVLFDVLPIFMNLALVAALAVAATSWKARGGHTVLTDTESHVRHH